MHLYLNEHNNLTIIPVIPGERWYAGKLQFMLSQRGKPLLVHDGHSFGIQYIRKDKKYWQCNLSRKSYKHYKIIKDFMNDLIHRKIQLQSPCDNNRLWGNNSNKQ